MNKSVEKFKSEKVSVVDLNGAVVMPGFIDPHTHFSITMFLSEMHDLSGFKHHKNRDVWKKFEDIVKNSKKDEWIVCKGLDPILTPNLVPPSIQYLDKIAPDKPVLIFSQSLHNYWANSKAFSLVGIDKNTPKPTENSYYCKDKNGELDGTIVEQVAVQPFFDILKSKVLTADKLSKAASKVMDDYAKKGFTTIVSAGITVQDKKPLWLFKHLSIDKPDFLGSLLEALGYFPKRKPRPRHFMYICYDTPDLLPEKHLTQNDFYDYIGIKHWYDGSPYIGTMYMNNPYLDSEFMRSLHVPKGHKGKALISKEELKQFIKAYHNRGWQIAIHAQGDAAIKEILDAFEELESELDYSKSKHRLEHCLMLPEEDIERMKRLNITPSFHINHLYYYGEALKNSVIGQERTEHILPIASVINKGIKTSLHADQPMFESLPFRLIQTTVERKTTDGNIIGKNQKISLINAIKAMTIDAAWQISKENKIGSLEKGKYADFIIIDKNPFKIKIENLEKIKILKTYVNGNLVHVQE